MVAAARARGESWTKTAKALGVLRQASRHWRNWPEVEAAEMVRMKKRASPRRPEHLGDRDRDVIDTRSTGNLAGHR